jgi:nucleoid-associated protein YgaU/DNA-binding SARP family transcriptional activator
MPRRWPTVLRGLLAALALAALVVGVPLLLVREVGWPLPTTIPSWSEVSQSITTGAIEDATIIKALAVLVWLAWANFAAGVLVEAIAIARDGVARRVAGLGPAQQLAANLLATISVAVTLLTRPTTPAFAAAPADLRVVVQDAAPERSLAASEVPGYQPGPLAATPGTGIASGLAGEPESSAAAISTSRYEVQRGDTLWDLADRLLGDGMRWREIRDLNVGRQQPDGTTINADTEDLRPGWTLRVPGQAPPSFEAAAVASEVDTVLVERGDTLWDLADEHLDDPHRWPEIYEENRGDPQPDGRALTDPDLIQPGWALDLPAPDRADVATSDEVVDPAPPAAIGHDGPDASADEPADDTTAPSETHGAPSEDDRDLEPASEVAEHPVELADPRPVPSSHAEPSEPADPAAEDIAVVPLAAAGTLAAGLVLTLDRVRRARLRRRRPHQRIPLPTGEEAAAEQRLRARANPDRDRFLNVALRELSGHYADHHPGPPVVLVSHGPADIAVHLEAPSDASPEGWERHDHDQTWSRHRPASLNTLDAHLGTPSRFPALVTLGTLPGGRIGLLNLAHVGCLHLDGDEDTARRLMAAWALELATTSRADALDVIVVGIDGLPDGLERLTPLADAEELREVLAQPHSNGKTNLPRTVIFTAGLPSDVSVLLRTTSERRGDLVAVVSGLQPRNGNWFLHIAASGRARLDPEGITFDLLDLGPEAAPMTAKLIEQALHDPEQLVQLPDDDEPETLHLDEPAAMCDTVEAAHEPDDEPTTEVRVLGPVEIVGTVEPFRTNKTIELIVYLALHRSGTDADTLLEALWPDQEPRPARLYTEASRARKSLGVAADGSPHFPDAELGRYRLADSVALDQERFAAAVEAARREPTSAIDHLRRALMLVRGVPLSATATEYAWATNEIYSLAQEVVDAAHDLAQLCLEAERYDDAIWAAERGLLADPPVEVLVRDLMEAAAATGNTSRVYAAMTRLRKQVAEDSGANDADDWLAPQTVETFRRLVGVGSAAHSRA